MLSSPPETSSHTVLSAASESRLWSTKAIFTVGPIFTVARVGLLLAGIRRNSVDLPAPFGPMMPTMAPAGTLKLRSSISTRSPKLLVTFLNSITSLPRRSATGMKISLVSLRFW
jgi:hypothetical protein